MADLAPTQQTAIGAALMRAAHLVSDGDPKVFEDPLAGDLLGLTDDEVRSAYNGYPTSAWVQRSRYTEDHLADAYSVGTRQYVLLGAGLDSFGCRIPPALAGLRVFEVDEPSIQAWKRARLDELGLRTDVVFVPCDFEVTTAGEALAAHGFSTAEPSFVSWLGVTQYLGLPAIEATLGWVAGLAPGTLMVFTYVPPEAADDPMVQFARAQGSTFDTFLSERDIEGLAHRAGLAIVEHPSVESLDERYFAGRSDGLSASTIERSLAVGV